MPLQAGELRHRIDIEDPVEIRSDRGHVITSSYQTFAANVPAKIRPSSVREFVASSELDSEIIASITIRYRAGLSPKQRIVHTTRQGVTKYYEVAGWLPDPDSGMEYVTAACSEGRAT